MSYFQAFIPPPWLREWIGFHLLGWIGLDARQIAFGVFRGFFDTVMLLFVGVGILTGGRVFMTGEYALPRDTQATAIKWAPIADQIARKVDIPREVPLVLWFKESSMQAVNPENCTGIMGTYDLVRSGERPCFTPGPISDIKITEQLTIGAIEFKKRCPEITYFTQDPTTIKKCYFAYNAGTGAAARLDANQSAYVMNNYDDNYRNMVYSDVELGTVRVQSLGAWPTHLAMQSLIVSQLDLADGERPLSIALLDLTTRAYDWGSQRIETWVGSSTSSSPMTIPANRHIRDGECLAAPHPLGNPTLRPRLNPVSESPRLTQDIHGCSYSLPGLDISSDNGKAILVAPMPGELTTFTDQWYNTTIRIENDEWIIWMLHPRSYLIDEGTVRRGDPVGIMGAIGNATGPHVHYTVFSKINETFVDPSLLFPQE